MGALKLISYEEGALEKSPLFLVKGSGKRESEQFFGLDLNPYGKILRSYSTGNGHERYLTTQHERDYETISGNEAGTGLDFRINRQYDSEIARFTSVDKLASHPNQIDKSPYQYVWGNPISLADPDGNCPFCPLFGTNSMPLLRPTIALSSNKNIVRVGAEVGSKAGRNSPNQELLRLGRRVEAEQLSKNEIKPNSTPMEAIDPKTGKAGRTIPDGMKDGGTVEVKNVKQQSFTRQLRLQKEISNSNGKQPTLFINRAARISKPLQNAGFDIRTFGTVPVMPADNTKINMLKPVEGSDSKGDYLILPGVGGSEESAEPQCSYCG